MVEDVERQPAALELDNQRGEFFASIFALNPAHNSYVVSVPCLVRNTQYFYMVSLCDFYQSQCAIVCNYLKSHHVIRTAVPRNCFTG